MECLGIARIFEGIIPHLFVFLEIVDHIFSIFQASPELDRFFFGGGHDMAILVLKMPIQVLSSSMGWHLAFQLFSSLQGRRGTKKL